MAVRQEKPTLHRAAGAARGLPDSQSGRPYGHLLTVENEHDQSPHPLRAAGNADRAAQAEVGFEPTNNGFAIRPLRPLGYSAATRKNNPLS